MVQSVLRNEADMIGASLTMNSERATAVDYLHPFGEERSALFVRNMRVQAERWSLYLEPISWETIMALALFAVIIPVFPRIFGHDR